VNTGGRKNDSRFYKERLMEFSSDSPTPIILQKNVSGKKKKKSIVSSFEMRGIVILVCDKRFSVFLHMSLHEICGRCAL